MDSYTLKSLLDLPAHFRSAFNFRYFNSLQSECFPVCFHSDANMVVSAPTGSGKTALFELCILRLLTKFISEEGRFTHLKGTLKTIYIAPSKALVQEKLREWNEKFGPWGINCLELTSDNEFYKMRNIQEADIVVTTPEKFDAVTRYRIKDGGLSFFGDIALLLIDEVHLLNDPRGATLEAIVSRIKMLSRNPEMRSSPLARVRFVAVSATIPNIEDLAEWLLVPVQGIKRFGEEMRPVKLTTKVFGYAPAKNDFLFEKRLQNYIFDILMHYSRGKSALVFCSTRKGAQEAAQCLTQTVMTFGHTNPFIKSKEQQERLREASLSCSDKQMQSYIVYGGKEQTYAAVEYSLVGYHNGGLCMKDRNLIESLFLKGDVQILCTTNTLAHGINLPAHTVVIKSTQHFNKEKGLYMEYDRSTILQMCGRAGRPPFDDTGMVIIMTRRETVHLYENLLNGCEMVESQLLSCVTEHLTAEIVQLTVSDITRAIEWMKCSYLYVRMKKNPENYSFRKGTSSDYNERHMQEICVQKVNELSQHQMIWTDEDGFLLKPLEPGKLMTKYYLKFNTMKHIMQTPENCSLEDALHIICRAEEIAWIQLRRNEKKLLNDINTDKDGRLRFHILGDKGKRKRRIQSREEKIFVLANDCLTGDPSIHDLSLTQDMNSICSNGCRIAKCMKEYFIYKKNYKGVLNSTLLAKSLHQKLWDDSPYLLKQLPGIGMVTAKALHSMGINSFETLAAADPRRIEIVTGRKYPFGNHIKDSLLSLPPKVEVQIEEIECQRQGQSKLVVTLTRLSQSVQSIKRHYADMIVGSEEDNLILFHEKIRMEEFSSPYSATILLSNPHQGKLTIKADLISEEYIGIDLRRKLLLMKESKFSIKSKQSNKQASSSPRPKEVEIIGDYETASRPPVKQHHGSANSVKTNCTMPSFNLIDEEPEKAELDVDVKEDECKVITRQTVFDHIREKAKNFPLLTAPRTACVSSSEPLILTRKRDREKQLELHGEVEVLEEIDRNKIIRPSVVNPMERNKITGPGVVNISSEPEDAGYIGHDNTKCTIPEFHILSPGTQYFVATRSLDATIESGFPPESNESTFKTSTEESIFDHIRKKSKNFPVINKLKTIDSGPLFWTKERYSKSQAEFGLASSEIVDEMNSDEVLTDAIIVLDVESKDAGGDSCVSEATTEVKHDLFSGSFSSTYGFVNLPPGVSAPSCDQSSFEKLSSDISVFRNDKQSGETESSIKSSRKQQCSSREIKRKRSSPNLSRRQCCLLETASETGESASILECKSVFSFL